ncbi:MAG: methylated-DNA--[protein]-cysteine S-methyltransferase [Dehalococcoidia bacterium]|nr:methylated-DNA--[protein]-cysteine S-methyltransferase [Dehalococcoidia bacterium]
MNNRAQAVREYSYTVFHTSMGWVAAVASPAGLRKLSLPANTEQAALEEAGVEQGDMKVEPEAFGDLPQQGQRFMDGEQVTFTMSLDLAGTPPFFKAALNACASIPRGERRSYAWLAHQAGSPLAVRAAGQAMARNPLPLIIPCHRVVGSKGSLTGYGGGLAMKTRLLELESR